MNHLTKISIVTVVYNAEDLIKKTLDAVREQAYENIEFIVIDGGSEDATLSLIKDADDIVEVLVSENDSGIYNAMNKGASLATGDYITFLNAGDIYYSKDALSDLMNTPNVTDYDVIYGANYYCVNNKLLYQKPRALELFYRGMPFNHQSVIVKSKIVKHYPFKDNVYKIQCEYDFLLYVYLNEYRFYCSDAVVAIYDAGGYSDMNFLERTLERWLIIKRAGICDSKADRYYLDLISKELGVSDLYGIKGAGKISFLGRLLQTVKNL